MRVYVSEIEYTHSRQVVKSMEDKQIRQEYTTVTLKENPDKEFKIFYCHQCRYPVFQYKGDVVQILPGMSPTRVPTMHQCKGRNCGIKYQITPLVK